MAKIGGDIEKLRNLVILNEDSRKQLLIIQGVVENRWNNHTGPPWHTFHNSSHSYRVEEVLYKLIPHKQDNKNELSENEWFYLIASAWLHDIGMIVKDNEDTKIVRDKHHLRSVEFITKSGKDLGLVGNDAQIVAELCKYHRKKEDINSCQERIGNVRLRLLASYLRLVDALHVDSTRIDEAHFKLLLAIGMPWESRFHWLKSKWVPDIIPEPDQFKLRISVYDTASDSLTNGLLPQLVEDEISEELESVRDILIRGKISCFLDIEIENIGEPIDKKDSTELEMILSNIKLNELLSASEAVNIIIKTFLRLADASPQSYLLIDDYLKQIEKVMKVRPCHTLIQTLLKTIKSIVTNDAFSDVQKVEATIDKLKSYFEKKGR